VSRLPSSRSAADIEFDRLLRSDLECPDLTGQILRRVHERRPFLSSRLFRVIRAGRGALAVGLLVGMLGVVLAQRFWPERVLLESEPAPVTELLVHTHNDAVRNFERIQTARSEFTVQEAMCRLQQTCGASEGEAPRSRYVILTTLGSDLPDVVRVRSEMSRLDVQGGAGGSWRIAAHPSPVSVDIAPLSPEPAALVWAAESTPQEAVVVPFGRGFVEVPLFAASEGDSQKRPAPPPLSRIP